MAAALAVVGASSADPLRVGIADDWPKFHPCGDVFWQASKDIGFQDLRMTVQWAGPGTTIPFAASIQAAVDCALLYEVRPILAIYPAKPALIGSSDAAQTAFAQFVGQVAQAYPRVQDFVVGNEPNVNRFWQPQYTGGQDAAGRDYEHTLAKAYDAIKLVRPDAVVWAPAISSRGNDDANALSNPSHSPVWFIKDLGDAYRESGRTRPIFDEFSIHPYPPVQDTDPFTKPFRWPQAGAANLDRIKQALWDAFHGTAQPLPAEQPVGRLAQSVRVGNAGLPIDLDEAGEQTMVSGHGDAYSDGPENIVAISEQQQAKAAVDLMEVAACDPDVKSLLFFPLIDDADLRFGFQSGELFADLTHKASYEAIRAKIATSNGQCQGGLPGIRQAWVHTTSVVGAAALFGGPRTPLRSQPPRAPVGKRYWAFSFTASEDTRYVATLAQVAGPRGGGRRTLATVTGKAHAYSKPLVRFPPRVLAAGLYLYTLKLTAAVNAGRTTTIVSKPFAVKGPPAAKLGQPKTWPRAPLTDEHVFARVANVCSSGSLPVSSCSSSPPSSSGASRPARPTHTAAAR
jgi:hypothetical protein